MTLCGSSLIVFGVVDPKPLRGFPQGRVKIRMRNDRFVCAFVKTKDGEMHQYSVRELGGFWHPAHKLAANVRANP